MQWQLYTLYTCAGSLQLLQAKSDVMDAHFAVHRDHIQVVEFGVDLALFKRVFDKKLILDYIFA